MNEPIPTSAPVGSAEKIEVLRQRYAQGLPLFHPHDRNDCSGLEEMAVTTRERKAAISERMAVHIIASKKMLSE